MAAPKFLEDAETEFFQRLIGLGTIGRASETSSDELISASNHGINEYQISQLRSRA
jgi:hypothetical protein